MICFTLVVSAKEDFGSYFCGEMFHCFCNIVIKFNYRWILDEGFWTVSRMLVN